MRFRSDVSAIPSCWNRYPPMAPRINIVELIIDIDRWPGLGTVSSEGKGRNGHDTRKH